MLMDGLAVLRAFPLRAAGRLVGLAGTALLAGCAGCVPLDKGTQSVTAAAAPSGVLDVRTENGAVEVRAADVSRVIVDATIRAEGKDRLAATRVVTQPGADGGVRVLVEWPDGRRHNNEGCSLIIQTPRGSVGGVRVDTSNGPVTLLGQGGAAEVDTSNGSVRISDHHGTVQARTSNGRIDLGNVEGNVRLDTSNGRIEMTDIAGAVNAETSNGSISLRLTGSCAQPFNLSTSNGSVSVQVGPSFAGLVDAQTSNGGVHLVGAASIQGSGERAQARFGAASVEAGGPASAASPRSVIRTSNGGVDVHLAP